MHETSYQSIHIETEFKVSILIRCPNLASWIGHGNNEFSSTLFYLIKLTGKGPLFNLIYREWSF